MSEREQLHYWIVKYLKYLQVVKRASNNTIDGYMNDLNQFDTYLSSENQATIDDFSRRNIRRFLATMLKEKSASTTIARKLASLRSFAKFLYREQVIQKNPTLNIASPKLKKHVPHFLSKEEIKRLLQIPDVTTFEGLRDLLMLELFYSTGMRVSEVAELTWSNVYLDEKILRVTGKRNKTRLIPMADRLFQDLQVYQREQSRIRLEYNDHVFVMEKKITFTRQQIGLIVYKYIKQVASTEKAHPHALRHTFATHLVNEGADIMSVKELLGHENLSTTQIYTHVNAEHLKKTYKNFHPRQSETGSSRSRK